MLFVADQQKFGIGKLNQWTFHLSQPSYMRKTSVYSLHGPIFYLTKSLKQCQNKTFSTFKTEETSLAKSDKFMANCCVVFTFLLLFLIKKIFIQKNVLFFANNLTYMVYPTYKSID